MTNSLFRKRLVIAVIVCLIGIGVIPNINSIDINLNDDNGKNNDIISPIKDNRIIHRDYHNRQKELVKDLSIKNQATIYNDDIIDQHQDDMYTGWASYSPARFAQSFKPKLNKLTRVEIPACRDGHDISGEIIISIHESLDGEALTSASIQAEDISICDPEYYPEWYLFNFPDIEVIPEKTYYIIFTPEQEEHESWVFWWGANSSSDPYIRGESWFDNDVTWEEISFSDNLPDEYYDFCFRTYGYGNNLDVKITGGFRVTVKVKNNGTSPAYNIPWSINIGECFYIRPGDEHQEDEIDQIAAGETYTIRQPRLFAIGKDVTITVAVDNDTIEKTASWILGPLVLGLY
jgi:hypothetical protein